MLNCDTTSPHLDAARDLKFWLRIAITMAVAAEGTQYLLVGRPAFLALVPSANWKDWINFLGLFAGLPACVLWIGGKNSPVHSLWPKLTLAVGIAIYVYLMFFKRGEGLSAPTTVITMFLGPMGILSTVVCLVTLIFRSSLPRKNWCSLYLQMAILMGTTAVSTNAALATNRLLFPATWDYFVYRIDGAFGGVATQLASLNAGGSPLVQTFTATVYALLIVAFYAIIGLAIRKQQVARLHLWRTFVFPFAAAWFLYALLPLSGPAYTFFDGRFPNDLPPISAIPSSQVVIPPAYRNAMPSMHLTGALIVWMLSLGLRHRVAILFSTILVLATVWSTLAMGEHYVLDLVVALPYAAFLGSALIWPQLLRSHWQTATPVWLAGISFAVWLILLRACPHWLSVNPWFVRSFSAWSLICAIAVFWRMALNSFAPMLQQESEQAKQKLPETLAITPAWIIIIFAVSGLAGLVYEVVYAKALAVTFGSTALASYTVLATYMGGMALGAWLGGIVADRVRSPLFAYAICEALIGFYAAMTPKLFILVQSLYVRLSLDTPPDAEWLTVLRLILGVVCLGLPTLLMGATMPFMFKYLRGLGITSRDAIAPLYGANVAGAALGSVIAGYLLLPAVGRNGGTYLAAVMSLLVSLYVLERVKRMVPNSSFTTVPTNEQPVQANLEAVSARSGMTALAILFLGGAVTLGLEVNSTHLLAVVAGNSVYAFSLMLATFLAGLGLGSFAGERLMDRCLRLDLVGWSQCGVAIAIGITAQTWGDLPSYFSSFEAYQLHLNFSARETVRALVCATAMLPAAFFIGMSYPAAMSLASDWLSPRGGAQGLGLASGLNTLGNIFGVLLIGFWLLPGYGSCTSSLVLALIALGLGLLALTVNRKRIETNPVLYLEKYFRWAPIVAASAVLSVFPSQWSYDDLATGGNVYFASQSWGKVVDHAESVEGGLTLVTKNSNGISTLLTNGKFQGNDAPGGEMLAQESFALFPLLHTSQRKTALVIGYGTGMTTRVLHESGFKQVDVAELSKDIVTMANRHFGSINQAVTEQAGVRMYYTDGRNFLLTQERRYDLISIEISSIWFAGAANLYNQDFYSLAKKRLTETGVLQQWIQLHHVAPIDLAYMIGSVRSEFEYVWLYFRGGQGIIIASNNAEALSRPGAVLVSNKKRNSTSGHQPDQLESYLLLSPAGIDRFISSLDPSKKLLVSTDSNLYLEHSTPKGNALGNVLPFNLNLLSSFEVKAR